MKNRLFLLKIGVLFALFSACQKDAIQVQWVQNSVKPDCEWRGVHFFDAQNGVVIGGRTWSGGFALRTKDGGATWQFDSLQQWSLYGLAADPKAKNTEGVASYTIGIGGEVFEQKKKDTTFASIGHPYWKWFRDIAVRRGHAVSVGGQGWQGGAAVSFEVDRAQSLAVDTFPQELESVAFADDSTVVAVGYGLVIRSTNGGKTWTPLKKMDGDFYTSVSFPSEKMGYIVGYAGTIMKTTDGGASWSILKSPSTFDPKRFKSIFFIDILRGYICGDNGLLWGTSDGGDSWQVVDNLPKVNFNDIFVANKEGWLVGSNGLIVKFSF